jgi:hypothetical protein
VLKHVRSRDGRRAHAVDRECASDHPARELKAAEAAGTDFVGVCVDVGTPSGPLKIRTLRSRSSRRAC